jgi:hypothetical protein
VASTAPSSPRAIAAYLVALRPTLAASLLARQEWVRRMGVLMEDARRGNAATVAAGAGRLGGEFGARFRDGVAALSRLTPPPACAVCHRESMRWLERLVEGCDVLVRVGRTGALVELRRAQELFAESRGHARAFNIEHARVVGDLRARVRELRSLQPRPRAVGARPPAPRRRPAGRVA